MITRIRIICTSFCALSASYFITIDAIAKALQYDISLIRLPNDVPIIDPAEMPNKLVLSKADGDDDAKNKINTADQLRKKFTNLTFSGSIKDAYNLYDTVANMSSISPDLRARAKINAAQLYPFANTDDSSYASIVQRKNETLKLFNDVIEEPTFSAEIRGWAKFCVAKLYVENTFDVNPTEAKQKAIGLFNEIISDKDVSSDTKYRVKLKLGTYYSQKKFDLSDADALQKANALFNEVKSDSNAPQEIKAEADFCLADVKNSDDDPYNSEKLKSLKTISTNPSYNSSIQSKAKIKIARGLLNGEFDAKPSEAVAMALTLYKEIVTDPVPGAKPESKLDPIELYTYKQDYAFHLANNAFHQKSIDAKNSAKTLYNTLVSDVSASEDQKMSVKWQLAMHYLEKKMDPPEGKDAKTAGVNLINEILNDPHVNLDIFLIVKLNFARLHYNNYGDNLLGLSPEQAKDDALSILNDLLNDSRLSGKQKEMIQIEINLWNGVVKQ